jgi:salicylate hydroxylase
MSSGEPSSSSAQGIPGHDETDDLRHVLVAGAGIGGLSAALFLAKAGWRVTVLDREPELQEFGAGLQIAPNASRLLEDIGVLADLDDFAVEPTVLNVRRGESGQILSSAMLGKTAASRFGAPFIVVHRADLQNALRRRAEANPHITLQLGHQLVDIKERETGITGLFETASGEVAIKADLLVGADGVWSRARTLAGLPSPSRYSGNTAWRALVPREHVPIFAREAEVNLWFGGGVHLVHYPVCGGRDINIVAVIEDDWREEGWSCPGDPDVIAAKFTPWCDKARELVASAGEWRRWALVHRSPEHRWSRARMTLLGDAAHPMMPFLAQGASSAIEDGATLAAFLEAPCPRPEQLALALKRYDAARIPRTARIQQEARRQGKFYHVSGLFGRLRDTALRVLPGEAMLNRYDWIFSHDARDIAP